MTIEQWLKRVFYLPDDRRLTVEYLIGKFQPCEGNCPFSPDNKRLLCYNNDDPHCLQWLFNERSYLRRNHAFNADYEELRKKVEARRQCCRDKINEFLDTEITEELLSLLRKQYDGIYKF